MRRGSTTNDRKNSIRFIFTKNTEMSPIPIFLRKSPKNHKNHKKPNKKVELSLPPPPPQNVKQRMAFPISSEIHSVFLSPLDGSGVWIPFPCVPPPYRIRDPWRNAQVDGGFQGGLPTCTRAICTWQAFPLRQNVYLGVGDTFLVALASGKRWVRLVVSSEWRIFLGWKMKGRGFLEPNPKKWEVWNGRWDFRFEYGTVPFFGWNMWIFRGCIVTLIFLHHWWCSEYCMYFWRVKRRREREFETKALRHTYCGEIFWSFGWCLFLPGLLPWASFHKNYEQRTQRRVPLFWWERSPPFGSMKQSHKIEESESLFNSEFSIMCNLLWETIQFVLHITSMEEKIPRARSRI